MVEVRYGDICTLLTMPHRIGITKAIYDQINKELVAYTMPFVEFSKVHPDYMYTKYDINFIILTDALLVNIKYLSNDKCDISYFNKYIVNSIDQDDKYGIVVTLIEE